MTELHLRYPVLTEWNDEDQVFVATSLSFPGLTGVNKSEADAVAELREAIAMAVELHLETGDTPPVPLEHSEYSGQFRLRVSKTLHRALARQAGVEGVSLNQLVLSYIAVGLGSASSLTQVEARVATMSDRLFQAVIGVASEALMANANVQNQQIALTPSSIPPQVFSLSNVSGTNLNFSS